MSDPTEPGDDERVGENEGVDIDPDDVSASKPDHEGSPMSGHDERPHLSEIERQGSPYTESQVIMATVKAVVPFAFTYGLFITFHGGGSPGGGFQGGAIMAAVIFMVAFAFGIDSTREWLANTVVVGLAVGGTLIFAGIGLATMVLGGAFLQYELLPIPKPVTYGMEGVEILGIAAIVSGVLMGLFFLLASGFARDEATTMADGGRPAGNDGVDGGRPAGNDGVDGGRPAGNDGVDGGRPAADDGRLAADDETDDGRAAAGDAVNDGGDDR